MIQAITNFIKGEAFWHFILLGVEVGVGGLFLWGDLTYVFASALSDAHMGSMHCTAAAVL